VGDGLPTVLSFHCVSHHHLCGRDRDRAVQRSPPLESLDQRRGLGIVRARELEVERDRVERREIGARLLRPVARTVDAHRYGSERYLLVARDHVYKLNAACGDRREEDLDGRDFLARTAILHWAVDDEVVIADAAQHAAEGVSRASTNVVLAKGW